MQQFLQQLENGIALGAIYALIAVGYTLVYGVLRTAMAGAGLLGFLIEFIAYRPLRNQPRINALITAIGVSMLLEFGFQNPHVFGASPRAFPAEIVPKLLPGTAEHPRVAKAWS